MRLGGRRRGGGRAMPLDQLVIPDSIMKIQDSVFRVLFAYFDEYMASIGGYEPWRSWNTVGLTPI